MRPPRRTSNHATATLKPMAKVAPSPLATALFLK
jgi:hypothetical protein